MKVTLVRHGETYANTEKRFAGWTDTLLTEKGKEQACNVRDKVTLEDYQVFVCSDLTRAKHTMSLLLEDDEKKIDVVDGFREMYFGQWENLTLKEMKSQDEEAVASWWQDYVHYKTPKGESLNDMYLRVNEAFHEMLKKNEGKNILLVSHSGVMRAILSKYICETVEGYWKFRIDNCAVVELEFVDGFPVIQFK